MIRSIIFNLFLLAWTICLSILCLPILFWPRKISLYAVKLWAWGVIFAARWITGIQYEIRGQKNIPATPVIFAAKHQSAWDTIIFLILHRDPAYIFKRELFFLPFYGWYLHKFVHVPVNRKSGSRALKKMLHAAGKIIANGRSLIIFPQGTRTKPGEQKPYLSGVVALSKSLVVPTVPVAITSGDCWPKNSWIKKPGTIIIEYLPAMPPCHDKITFLKNLEYAIEGKMQELQN